MATCRSAAWAVWAFVVAAATASAQEIVNLELAAAPPSSASPTVPQDFQSFSIEFAFWGDYAGNHSHPNNFTNQLFANLRNFRGGTSQIIRVGGNTHQQQDIINYWNYSYNQDQPQNSTIGPSFWQTFTSLDGLSYIFGLNFYKNDSSFLSNLESEVGQSLKQIPPDRLHLFELGNENDYGAESGFRPANWTQEDWVEEWQYRTTHMQTQNDSLRFFAPSCCCFNITTPYSFFSPWTIWNSTFDFNRDGWINEVSQHGYISSTSLKPTLQGTLMNHTSVVINCSLHDELNQYHKAAGRKYTIGETNSVSGQGAYGVSDVFGSAMFIVDYELYIASKGIARMHLHQGTGYRYAAWLPVTVNGTGPYVKPPYYGHAFVSKFLGNSTTAQIDNIDLGSDYYSAYALYEDGRLSRVALLNLHAWDPTNSTKASSAKQDESRPKTTFSLGPVAGATSASVELLTAPGATSNTSITLAGVSYDYDKGQGRPVRVGPDTVAVLKPGKEQIFSFDVEYSQIAIVNFHR